MRSGASTPRACGAGRLPPVRLPAVTVCLSCRGGQRQDRTADLPLFRRTLIPTELPDLGSRVSVIAGHPGKPHLRTHAPGGRQALQPVPARRCPGTALRDVPGRPARVELARAHTPQGGQGSRRCPYYWSSWPDSNWRSPRPKRGALARLRYSPSRDAPTFAWPPFPWYETRALAQPPGPSSPRARPSLRQPAPGQAVVRRITSSERRYLKPRSLAPQASALPG
jgi:hypothetical protein